MNHESVCVYGAGGHAKVVIESLKAAERNIDMFFDDNATVVENSQGVYQPGLRLTGEQNFCLPELPFLLAIGNNHARSALASQLRARYSTAIHPSATIAPTAVVGAGSVVFAQAVLQPSTIVGEHAIINTSASIDHDCRLANFSHVSPNATLCGNVQIGEGSHVGAGATIIEGIRVGRWATVGAGSVVIRDVPDFTTVAGCPARVIKTSGSKKINQSSNAHSELLDINSDLLDIVNVIRKGAGRDELKQLSPTQTLQQDLQLDSLELAEMAVLIEAKFGVDVFEHGIVKTVRDVLDRIG